MSKQKRDDVSRRDFVWTAAVIGTIAGTGAIDPAEAMRTCPRVPHDRRSRDSVCAPVLRSSAIGVRPIVLDSAPMRSASASLIVLPFGAASGSVAASVIVSLKQPRQMPGGSWAMLPRPNCQGSGAAIKPD